MAPPDTFGSVPLGDLPLRALREVSAMASEVEAALRGPTPDHRKALDAVLSSPRTPFLGALLIALALCLLALDG